MQYLQTPAIILQKTQIKDFKYILKILSEKQGLISLDIEINNLIQPAHIQPPNLMDVKIITNKYKKLSALEMKPLYIYQSLYTNYKKNIIAQFISEILIKTIREELADEKVFHLSFQSFIELDKAPSEALSVFHLHFLKKYIIHTGHSPLNNYDDKHPYFHFTEGRFTSYSTPMSLSADDSKYIYQLFFEETFPATKLPISRLTHHLIDYLKYHLSLQHLHSLPFLKEAIALNEPL